MGLVTTTLGGTGDYVCPSCKRKTVHAYKNKEGIYVCPVCKDKDDEEWEKTRPYPKWMREVTERMGASLDTITKFLKVLNKEGLIIVKKDTYVNRDAMVKLCREIRSQKEGDFCLEHGWNKCPKPKECIRKDIVLGVYGYDTDRVDEIAKFLIFQFKIKEAELK
jgi:hypothetical protein